MIITTIDFDEIDKEVISTRRVKVSYYPLFTKHDPLEVFLAYLGSFREECIDDMVDLVNFPDDPPDSIFRRKRKTKKTKPSVEVTTTKVSPKASL